MVQSVSVGDQLLTADILGVRDTFKAMKIEILLWYTRLTRRHHLFGKGHSNQ